jgi:predicted CXXCH cytochrome family protein
MADLKRRRRAAGKLRSPSHEARRPGAPRRTGWALAAATAFVVLAGGLALYGVASFRTAPRAASSEATVQTSRFVGSEACAGCHRSETVLWQASQHKQAMDHANEKTVLGDFSGTDFTYFGVRSRFYRANGKYLVETDGPDGKLAAFEVKYTFGVSPLQQYLIEFPDGRIQALSAAWDSRAKADGGQRWFHLYPTEEVKSDDVLHWTKPNQNWNFMCAECHSTGVRKNYDAARDHFATTWAEISVGCEACHGQGSRHVGWARDRKAWWPFGKHEDATKGLTVRFDERRDVTWVGDPTSGNPRPQPRRLALRKEVETCGLCHARRSAFSEDWVPGRWLSETHAVSPLSHGLYEADGQMLDEVYNYGSFKQSKMFAAGVTCSDCHDPHSARLRASGDAVCTRCHAPDKYAAASHHRHEAASPQPGCAACHMLARTYMVVDRRHEHSFRIPRPDLTARLGTPNACNGCHSDKSAEWAASAVEGWHGPDRKGFQTYAAAFHAAWSQDVGSTSLLAAVASDAAAPAFARAGALGDMAGSVSPANVVLAQAALKDPDPMVRIGALDMLDGIPVARLWPLAAPVLSDAVRGVRIRAAALLAMLPTASQPVSDRAPFERAAGEFIAAQRRNADRPEARATLGNFFARRGLPAEAEAEYRAALRLSPAYAPAAINLADLDRRLGREAEGEQVLRAAIAVAPRDGGLHHALGLGLTRSRRPDEALAEFGRAAELEPDRSRYAYVFAVALHSAGRVAEALTVLKGNIARHPNDIDTLTALVAFSRGAGDDVSALAFAETLSRANPNDRGLAVLVQDLQRRVGTGTGR